MRFYGSWLGGWVAHLIYGWVLPWRVTGVVVCWLLSAVYLFLLLLLVGDHSWPKALESTGLLVYLPIEFLQQASRRDILMASVPFYTTTLLFLIAHPIRPNLLTAVFTALGVATWYGFAFLLAASAG